MQVSRDSARLCVRAPCVQYRANLNRTESKRHPLICINRLRYQYTLCSPIIVELAYRGTANFTITNFREIRRFV